MEIVLRHATIFINYRHIVSVLRGYDIKQRGALKLVQHEHTPLDSKEPAVNGVTQSTLRAGSREKERQKVQLTFERDVIVPRCEKQKGTNGGKQSPTEAGTKEGLKTKNRNEPVF